MQQNRPRKSGVKVRVGSLTVVIPGKDGTNFEDDSNGISIVQQNPLIITRPRKHQPAGPEDNTEGWI